MSEYNDSSLKWFHDVLKKDGSPYNETEYKYIQSMATQGGGLLPADWESYKPALVWIVLPVVVLSLLLVLVVKVLRKRRNSSDTLMTEQQVADNDLELI